MDVYINGIGLISPQETRNNQVFLEEIIELQEKYFPLAKPPYKEYINPRELRRMGSIIRNGIIAGKIAMADTNIQNPDAIITGTGLGCATDTEKFLTSLVNNKETLLTPTSFIQSTHNTLGGSIAIGLGCHNYNMTYVHRGLSFETALIDAQLMLEAGEINNALVGGFDEMTDNYCQLLNSTAMYNSEDGAIPGQGAGFFMLENEKAEHSYAKLLFIETLYNPDSVNDIEVKIQSIIDQQQLKSQNTLVMMGYNGFQNEKEVYNDIRDKIFSNFQISQFKNLCGEYYTASAFAFWTASQILKKQVVPAALHHSGKVINQKIENIIIYNRFQEKEHSFIILGAC